MARKKTFTVNSESGLNLRKAPSKSAEILSVLGYGEKVTVIDAEAPEGWTAVDGGYVMTEYLK